jgi:hypothetical protein
MKTPTYLFAADGSMVLIDASEVPAYIAKGYRDTPDAFAALDADDSGSVTRSEMEQKARELGLKFDGRTTDRKLLALIEAAL